MTVSRRIFLGALLALAACVLMASMSLSRSYADEPADVQVPATATQPADTSSASDEGASAAQATTDGSQGQTAQNPASGGASASGGDAAASTAPKPASTGEAEAAQAEAEQADAEEDEEDEQVAKRKELIEKLQVKADEAASKALDLASQASAAARSLPDKRAALDACYGPLNEQRDAHAAVLQQAAQIDTALAVVDKRIKKAERALQDAKRELEAARKIDLKSLLRGDVDFAQMESLPYLLNKLVRAHEQTLAQAKQERAELQQQRDALAPAVDQARAAITQAVRVGNAAAFEIEAACAEMRQYDREASDALEAFAKELEEANKDIEKPVKESDLDGFVEARQTVKSARAWHDDDRAPAQEMAGDWYDAIDSLSSETTTTPSFGVGDDFLLSKEEFVAKWGPAIDAFYASWGDKAGQTSPMAGLGTVMAEQAYQHRIDPRLCAAVSIVESSGGLYCIKPFNAWGWGAADSDPYNLAFGWSSWEEAVAAWHEGVITNTAGLATPKSLSGFGDIYCSTPIWAKNVAGYMTQITDFAYGGSLQEQDADPAAEGEAA